MRALSIFKTRGAATFFLPKPKSKDIDESSNQSPKSEAWDLFLGRNSDYSAILHPVRSSANSKSLILIFNMVRIQNPEVQTKVRGTFYVGTQIAPRPPRTTVLLQAYSYPCRSSLIMEEAFFSISSFGSELLRCGHNHFFTRGASFCQTYVTAIVAGLYKRCRGSVVSLWLV